MREKESESEREREREREREKVFDTQYICSVYYNVYKVCTIDSHYIVYVQLSLVYKHIMVWPGYKDSTEYVHWKLHEYVGSVVTYLVTCVRTLN